MSIKSKKKSDINKKKNMKKKLISNISFFCPDARWRNKKEKQIENV